MIGNIDKNRRDRRRTFCCRRNGTENKRRKLTTLLQEREEAAELFRANIEERLAEGGYPEEEELNPDQRAAELSNFLEDFVANEENEETNSNYPADHQVAIQATAMQRAIIDEAEKLFENASISKPDALRYFAGWQSRFKVPDAAATAMLKLMHEQILPRPNNLPVDLRTVRKQLNTTPILVVTRTANFVVFDAKSQIEAVIQRHLKNFVRHRARMKAEDCFDYCGTAARDNLDSFVNIVLYSDSGQLAISSRIGFTPIIGQLKDLPPIIAKSVENCIFFGIHVGPSQPNWKTIFEALMPQIRLLVEEPGIQITNGVFLKISRFVELIADNKALNQMLFLFQPGAYKSCPKCLVGGEYSAETSCVNFHEIGPSRTRANWMVENDRAFTGIKDITPLVHFMEIPSSISLDTMHTIDSGIFKQNLNSMYTHNARSKRFFDSLKLDLLQPCEFNRPIRNFSLIAMFKANEFRRHCLYFAPLYLMEYAKISYECNLMASNTIVLCAAMNILAAKNLTSAKIDVCQNLIAIFQSTFAEAFPLRPKTFKFHITAHLIETALLHGSPPMNGCYFGESVLGFLAKCVKSPPHALHQLINALKFLHSASGLNAYSKQLFNTKHISIYANKFCYPFPTDNGILDFLRSRYDLNMVECAKEIKIGHLIVKARKHVYAEKANDSIVYIKSAVQQGFMQPCIVELFFKLLDCHRKFAIVRALPVKEPIANLFSNVEPRIIYQALFKEAPIFTNCFALHSTEGGELVQENLIIVEIVRIFTKGFIVKFNATFFVFPLGEFEHD